MQYKVPQFIEVEDKLFGPLTFKQAVYLVGGAGGAFIIWNLVPAFFAIILIAPIIGLSLALAFYKVNSQPFIVTLEAFIKYTFNDKLYIWTKDTKKETARGIKLTRERQKQENETKKNPRIAVPTVSGSRIHDLSWSLDINENIEERK